MLSPSLIHVAAYECTGKSYFKDSLRPEKDGNQTKTPKNANVKSALQSGAL